MYYETLVSILASVTLLTAVVYLRQIAGTMYSTIGCVLRWKENLNLENSVKLRRDRNTTTAILLIPFCLIVNNFDLYSPDFARTWNEFAGLGLSAGVLAVYLILRVVIRAAAGPRNLNKEIAGAMAGSWSNFFIICTALLLITAGICSFAEINAFSIKKILLYETGAVFVLFIFRKGQILANSCSLLMTILYLCALEILPAVFIVSSAVFL